MVPGLLDGFRIIDFGSFITAPFAAMLLGDLGAEIIKVERPGGGDPFRSFEQGLYGPQFKAFNRNKKSLVLDLDLAADREMFAELIRASDVLIENYRPGVMTRLGFDATAAAAINARLIYCSITGFGPDGPSAAQAAYDTVAQAASGYLSLFVSPEDMTIKGPAVADVTTGLYAAYGVLAALLSRERTCRGRLVEVPMMAAMAHFASEPFQHYFTRGIVPTPVHRSQISQSFAFVCADGGLLAIHLSSPPKFWDGLIAATGRDDLPNDPRFASRMLRIDNYRALEQELAATFRERTRPEWMSLLSLHDVPHAPVLSLDDVITQPQARHLALEQQTIHPVEGLVRSIRNPLTIDGQPPQTMAAPPALGEHDASMRKWLTMRLAQRTNPK